MVTGKSAMKSISIIIIIGFISRVLGFVRELVVANFFGTSREMDAYNIAFNVPGILLAGLSAAVTIIFIPSFTEKLERSDKKSAFELSRKIFTAFTLLGVIISTLGIIFATQITHLLAPSFSRDQLVLTVGLTRVLLLSGVFTLLIGLCTGLLQAQENFTIPSLLGFPLSICIIGSVVLWSRSFGIYALAYGTVLSVIAQVLFMVPSALKTGFNFIPSIDFKDPDLLKTARLVVPVFIGTMLLQVNTIVDRIFASGLPVGSISALNYANKVNNLLVTLVASSIATVALPALSQAAAAKDLPRLRTMMLYAVQGINVLVIPMTVGMVILRVPLVRLFFERGAFDSHATELTSVALLFLSVGLFAYGLREIFSRVFYSLQDTTTPMINSGITIAFNIVLIILLVPYFGLAGLAGATSISGIFGSLQLIWRLRRKIGNVQGLAIAVSFIKITVSSLFMGCVVYYLYPVIRGIIAGPGFFQQLMAVALISVIGVIAYLGGLVLLRAKELQILKGILRRKAA